jgi:O-antigen/teichoic acid export membrane protein
LSLAVVTVLGLAQVAILARFLEPQEFGQAAVAQLVIAFGQVLAVAGLAEAAIQRKNLAEPQFSGLYWAGLLAGLVGYMLAAAAATPLARILNQPSLAALIPVAAVALLIAPFGSLHQAMERKNLKFRSLAIAEMLAAAVHFVVAVISASVFAQGVWSIVFGGLASAATLAGFFVVRGNSAGFRASWRVDWKALPELLTFGMFRVGSGLLNLARRRADQAIIAVTMGTQALGFYAVAVQMFELPLKRIPAVINKIILPTFSLIQDDVERLKRGFLLLALVVASVISPMVFGLAAIAHDAIAIYLGEGWSQTASVLQFIPVYVVLRAIAGSAGAVVVARGRADWAFYWALATLPVGLLVIAVLSVSGQLAVLSAGLSVLQVILFWVHWRMFLSRIIPLGFAEYVRAVRVPIVLGLVMALFVAGVLATMTDHSPLARVAVGIGMGTAVYVVGTWYLNPEIKRVVRERMRSSERNLRRVGWRTRCHRPSG